MVDAKPLRVRSRPGAMVTDYDAMFAGVRRYVGWKHDPTLGDNGGFRMLDEPVELPAISSFLNEYRGHVRDGELVPDDEYTARFFGVATPKLPPPPPVPTFAKAPKDT